MVEKEITRPLPLTDGNGLLNEEAIGWSREPLFDCHIEGRWPRKRRWNYWCFYSPHCILALALVHLDYMGYCFLYCLEPNSGLSHEQAYFPPLGLGLELPDTLQGTALYRSKKVQITQGSRDTQTNMEILLKHFGGHPLEAHFIVSHPRDLPTLNAVIPWSKKKFHCTSKQIPLPLLGHVRWGQNTYDFNRDTSWACLDFGRGVWPHSMQWQWAAGGGRVDGKTLGFNVGGLWTQGTGMTENFLVLNQKPYKISQEVVFTEEDETWQLKTLNSPLMNLSFQPTFSRNPRFNLLFLYSNMAQHFGHFTGNIALPEEKPLTLASLPGWVETHNLRW